MLLCHPEPYARLNTGLLVVAFPGPASAFLRRYVTYLRNQYSDLSIVTPVEESSFAGHPASHMEVRFTGTNPLDSSRHLIQTRLWAIDKRSRVLVVFAQQPAPPDPACTAGLEAVLGTVEIE
jgi:hypothetical protein